jgi:hypothetical protein
MSGSRSSTRRVLCALLAVFVPLSGCGAILFPVDTDVEVLCTNVPNALFSAPKRGAAVRSGNALSLDRREDYRIVVTAPGYVTQEVLVESEISVWRTILSCALSGSLGYFLVLPGVLAISADIKQGAWRCLEDTPVVVELVPDEGGPAPPAPTPTASTPTASPPQSAFCTSCGARAGDSSFCTSCGTRVRR